MKCDLSIEFLNSYLDDELNKEEKQRVEKHLKECQSCMEELAQLRWVDACVKEFEVEEPSREFIFNLNRRVMERVRKKRHFSFLRISPVLVPITVALLVFIVLINTDQGGGSASLDDRIFYTEIKVKKELDLKIPEPAPAIAADRFAPAEKGVVGKSVPEKSVAERVESKKAKETAKEEAPSLRAGSAAKSGEIAGLKDDREDEGIFTDRDEILSTVSIEGIDIPQDRIVRAIIDTTGRVLKVATGNSIIPEKDTMLENRLQGQQLRPASVCGRNTQMYVDLTQETQEVDTNTK